MAVVETFGFENPTVAAGLTLEAVPSGWTLTVFTTGGFFFAQFAEPFLLTEAFEQGWSGNEATKEKFLPVDLTLAQFGSALGFAETFESEWAAGNEAIVDELDELNTVAALFDSSGDPVEDIESEWPARHPVADVGRLITETIVAGQAESVQIARANEIKADYNAHIADAVVHVAADATNTITSPDAADQATLFTLVDEMWLKVWFHIGDGSLTFHLADTRASLIKPSTIRAQLPPVSLDQAAELLDWLTVYCNLHFTWADNSGKGLVTSLWVFLHDAIGTIYERAWEPRFGTILATEEDFEQEWKDNEGFLPNFTPGDLTEAEFASDSPPLNVETFEETLSMNIVLVTGGEGTPIVVDPTGRVAVTFGGTLNGTLEVQFQRPGSTTWITQDSVSGTGGTIFGTVDMTDGIANIRIFTVVYTAGGPAADLNWRQLSSL